MTQEFVADIKNWSKRAIDKVDNIHKQSIQDVANDAQKVKDYTGERARPTGGLPAGGRMPYLTGFLRNSIFSETATGGRVDGGENDEYKLGIALARLGEQIDIGWSAKHAAPQEFGTSDGKIKPNWFARGAAEKWPRFVEENARQVRDD